MMDDAQVRQRVEAIEGLLERTESLPEEARAVALDTVQALVEVYGEALRRLLHAADGGPAGPVARRAAGDELLAHLFLLHDLHPPDVEPPRIDPPAAAGHGGNGGPPGGGFVPIDSLRGRRPREADREERSPGPEAA